MKAATRWLCCLFVLICFSSAWADTALPDGSLTEEEYYQTGMPRAIEGFEDYDKAVESFQLLAEADPCCLPRYNSEKSKAIFHLLFDESLPDNIAHGDMPIVEKRQWLAELYMSYDRLLSVYLISQRGCTYDNECIRISSLSTHAQILALELMQAEMDEYHINPADAFPDSQRTIMLFVKEMYMDLWTFEYYPKKAWKNADGESLSKIKQDAESYKKRILAIKFLDYENNVKKLDLSYKPCGENKPKP